jgi:Fe-S cluster biosynthesis and repair protein YggX
MMICRCAWHPYYYGHPLWNGVVSWRGWSVRFTDGICQRCVQKFRAEHRDMLERRMREPVPVEPQSAA